MKVWRKWVEQKTEADKQVATIDMEIKHLGAIIKTQNSALDEKQENLMRLQNKYSVVKKERVTLYGDKQPDNEETRLNKAIENAENAEKTNKNLTVEREQQLRSVQSQIKSLKKRLDLRAPDLQKAETDFSIACVSKDFGNEALFIEARLPIEEQESLSRQMRKLDEGLNELNTRRKDREISLATEIEKKMTDQTLEALVPTLKKYEESLKNLRDTIAGFKHKLNDNAEAKDGIKKKQFAIDIQKKECHRWEITSRFYWFI